MNFSFYDLGHLAAGSTVVVDLSAQANVRLLDDVNFARYRRGDEHAYYGGLATVTPFEIVVPHARRWHLVVDLGGYAGSVRHSLRVRDAA